MKIQPTYSALEIKELLQGNVSREMLKIISDLLDEEIDLYPLEDIPILIHASMIIFTRALLIGSMKKL